MRPTREFFAEFIRQNHSTENREARGPARREKQLTVIDMIRILQNFPGDTPVIIRAKEMSVYRPLGNDVADVALMTAPDPATPGPTENLHRIRVGQPAAPGHRAVCAIGLYSSEQT